MSSSVFVDQRRKCNKKKAKNFEHNRVMIIQDNNRNRQGSQRYNHTGNGLQRSDLFQVSNKILVTKFYDFSKTFHDQFRDFP